MCYQFQHQSSKQFLAMSGHVSLSVGFQCFKGGVCDVCVYYVVSGSISELLFIIVYLHFLFLVIKFNFTLTLSTNLKI